jgi:hypothetical protein
LSRLDVAAKSTRETLESFGMVTGPTEEKAKKSRFRWLI